MPAPGFGDRKYAEAVYTPAYHYAPKSPVTYAIGNVLRQVYMAAQSRGRTCLMQSYGYNTRDWEADSAYRRAAQSATYIGVARGWCDMPDEVNKLIAQVVFAAHVFSPITVTHRLTIDDGTNADQTTATIDLDDQGIGISFANGNLGPGAHQNFRSQRGGQFPFTNYSQVYVHTFDLDFSNVSVSAPGNCEIRVDVLMPANSVPYQPLFATVLWDMEY